LSVPHFLVSARAEVLLIGISEEQSIEHGSDWNHSRRMRKPLKIEGIRDD
jgi:hypothetical protein